MEKSGFSAIFVALLLVLSVASFALAEENGTDDSATDQAANESIGDNGALEDDLSEDLETEAGTNETEVEVEAEAEETIEIPANETPSVTPDEPVLWGFKRAIEKIDYLITLGKAAKAQ